LNYLDENTRAGRIVLPDLVRAFALIGIALVNVAYFAYPGDVTYHDGGLQNAVDHSAYFAVNALFLFKSYTLFSFMFGVALAHQMTSAQRRGKSFGPAYFRRLTGLLILGILHVTFAFVGDILIIYSILGMLLYCFRHSSQKKLVRIGLVMIALQVLIALLFSASLLMAEQYSPDQWVAELNNMQVTRESANSIYANGSFSEIASQRWTDWTGMMIFAAPLQAPGAFGFFLIGLAAVRSKILANPNHEFWNKARKVYLPLGVLISVTGSYIYMQSAQPVSASALAGMALLLLAAPLSSLGYIGLIAKWSSGPMTPLKIFLARGGTSSLTAYLSQSLILSLIFCAYGLGLFGKLSASTCVAIALVVGLFTIILTSLWRTRFERGPMEFLLRRWTYLSTN